MTHESDNTLAQKLQQITRICRDKKFRMTPQRLEIYKEVASSTEHPDADTVFQRVQDRLPNLSRDTVYRTLSLLEQVGLLHRISSLCGRSRFDANPLEHHHFICKKCNAVLDIYLTPEEKITIPQMSTTLGQVDSLHLQIRGICTACQEKNQTEAEINNHEEHEGHEKNSQREHRGHREK